MPPAPLLRDRAGETGAPQGDPENGGQGTPKLLYFRSNSLSQRDFASRSEANCIRTVALIDQQTQPARKVCLRPYTFAAERIFE